MKTVIIETVQAGVSGSGCKVGANCRPLSHRADSQGRPKDAITMSSPYVDSLGPPTERHRPLSRFEREAIDENTVKRLTKLGRQPLRDREEILVDTVVEPGVVYEVEDETANRWIFAESGAQRARRYHAAMKAVSSECEALTLRQFVLRPLGARPGPGELQESLKRLSEAYDKRFGYLVRPRKAPTKGGNSASRTSPLVAPLLSALHLIVDEAGAFDPHLHVMCCVSESDLPDVLAYLRKHFLLTPESGALLVTPSRFAYYMASHVLPYASLKAWPDSHLLAFWDLPRRRFLRPAGRLAAYFAAQKKKPKRKTKSKKARPDAPPGSGGFTLRGYVQGQVGPAETVFAQMYRRRKDRLGAIETTRVEVRPAGRVLELEVDASTPKANISEETVKASSPNFSGAELSSNSLPPNSSIPEFELEPLAPDSPGKKKRKPKAAPRPDGAPNAHQPTLRIYVPNLDDLYLTRLFIHHRMDVPSRTFEGTCLRMKERPDRILSAIRAVESFMECSLFADRWTPSQHGRYFHKKYATPLMEISMIYVDLSAERRLGGTADEGLLPVYRHFIDEGASHDASRPSEKAPRKAQGRS